MLTLKIQIIFHSFSLTPQSHWVKKQILLAYLQKYIQNQITSPSHSPSLTWIIATSPHWSLYFHPYFPKVFSKKYTVILQKHKPANASLCKNPSMNSHIIKPKIIPRPISWVPYELSPKLRHLCVIMWHHYKQKRINKKVGYLFKAPQIVIESRPPQLQRPCLCTQASQPCNKMKI